MNRRDLLKSIPVAAGILGMPASRRGESDDAAAHCLESVVDDALAGLRRRWPEYGFDSYLWRQAEQPGIDLLGTIIVRGLSGQAAFGITLVLCGSDLRLGALTPIICGDELLNMASVAARPWLDAERGDLRTRWARTVELTCELLDLAVLPGMDDCVTAYDIGHYARTAWNAAVHAQRGGEKP